MGTNDGARQSPLVLQLDERKKADREAMDLLPPDQVQAEVERILYPRLWRVDDPGQLDWPGDLADDDEG